MGAFRAAMAVVGGRVVEGDVASSSAVSEAVVLAPVVPSGSGGQWGRPVVYVVGRCDLMQHSTT